MPEAINTTNITPPRVPMVDPQTGIITRDWYRFFTSLFRLTGSGENTTTLQDVQLGPDAGTDTGMAVLASQIEDLAVSPPVIPQAANNRYGAFLDTTTQTAAAINTAYAMTFNTTQLSNGVTVGTPTSRIYVDRLGVTFSFRRSLTKSRPQPRTSISGFGSTERMWLTPALRSRWLGPAQQLSRHGILW